MVTPQGFGRRFTVRIPWIGGVLVALAAPVAGQLSVNSNGRWVEWYRPDRAPRVWQAEDTVVRGALRWREGAAGIELGELRVHGGHAAARFKVIVARFDARQLSFALTRMNDWSVVNAPDNTVIAFNAGQSIDALPWGWLVQNGDTLQPVGADPLSSAVIQDGAGRIHIIARDKIATLPASVQIRWAFQSYPTLLADDGAVTPALLARGRGVDNEQRDARLALCTTRDDRTMVMLTRYDVLGGLLEGVPIGPTVPEMAALAGALGCAQAVLLEGGLSAQLMLQHADGDREVWKGWRAAPLGLMATPR